MASTDRTRADDGPRCRYHATATAGEACARCGAPICDVCATFAASRVACPPCEVALGRRRKLQAVGLVAGIAVAVGAGAAFTLHGERPGPWVPPPEPGASEASVDRVALLEAELARTPCFERDIVDLVRALSARREHDAAVRRADAYVVSGCPSFPKLLRPKREALVAAGRHEAAEAVTTELLEAQPLDKDAWWWRAETREKLGRLEDARADYEQSFALSPATSLVAERLALLDERLGRPCDGIAPLALNALLGHDAFDSFDASRFAQWATRLERSDACAGLAVSGEARLASVDGRLVDAAVAIDGHVAGRFVVDRARTAVLVSRAAAERLRLAPGPVTRRVQTAEGPKLARLAQAGRVSVGAATAPHVELAVVDEGVPLGFDGVLGAAFLVRFRVGAYDDGSLTLAPRPLEDAPPAATAGEPTAKP